MDGAGPVRGYLAITLPLLRPSLVVAAVINVINVFNSFPIIWAMTRGGPGVATDPTTTYLSIPGNWRRRPGSTAPGGSVPSPVSSCRSRCPAW
ncbi:hypothetical protein [Streptomyces sp. NPDC001492]